MKKHTIKTKPTQPTTKWFSLWVFESTPWLWYQLSPCPSADPRVWTRFSRSRPGPHWDTASALCRSWGTGCTFSPSPHRGGHGRGPSPPHTHRDCGHATWWFTDCRLDVLKEEIWHLHGGVNGKCNMAYTMFWLTLVCSPHLFSIMHWSVCMCVHHVMCVHMHVHVLIHPLILQLSMYILWNAQPHCPM